MVIERRGVAARVLLGHQRRELGRPREGAIEIAAEGEAAVDAVEDGGEALQAQFEVALEVRVALKRIVCIADQAGQHAEPLDDQHHRLVGPNHLHDAAWMISTEAGKDVSEATIAEVYKEMQLLRDELVDDEELLLVKNFLIGTVLGDLDGPFHIIGRWKNIILNNLDENYFYHSVDTIKNISAKELQELANKYLVAEDFYELVVV